MSYEEGLAVTGAERIAAERRRQIEQEGYSVEHDLAMPYEDGALVFAAICYATPQAQRSMVRLPKMGSEPFPVAWPWTSETWKGCPDQNPSIEDRIRELEKAGALIAAEIDRLIAIQEEQR